MRRFAPTLEDRFDSWAYNLYVQHGSDYAEHDEGDAAIKDDGWNDSKCCKCRTMGELVCCDVCPRAYHMSCLNKLPPSGSAAWKCPQCRRGPDTALHSVRVLAEKAALT